MAEFAAEEERRENLWESGEKMTRVSRNAVGAFVIRGGAAVVAGWMRW
jgi:hypothetical protein